MNLLTHNEAQKYLETQELPEDFSERLENFLEFEVCTSCDGVRCMHFVLRDWWSEDFDRCKGNCCPFCGEVDPNKYKMGQWKEGDFLEL